MAKSQPILISLGEGENIPLTHLRLSADNVRKIYARDAIPDMAEAIRVNGLIQSLSVRKLDAPEGDVTHEVIGGGRRFRALQLLLKQKVLSPDALIPCVPNDRQVAAQISLAENTQREPLHPLDEFRACEAMRKKDMSEEAIAEALRLPLRTVKQRLRMANAAPVILKAFEDGKVTLSTLMAFCITDNQERQEQVWKQVKNGGLAEWFIKEKLMEDTVPTSDKRAKFVGLAAYEKAGGIVERNLFDDSNGGFIKDVDLLNQLAQAKLERAAEKIKSEGWAWATAAPTIPYGETSQYDQVSPLNEDLNEEEQAHYDALSKEHDELLEIPEADLTKKQAKRLEAVAAEIDAIDNREPIFSTEDMARGGITVEIGHDGKLRVERGYVKPEETDESDAQGQAPGQSSTSEAEDDSAVKIGDALINDLTIQRTVCLQAALMANPDVAFLATLHAMTLTALYSYGSSSALQITASTGFPSQLDGLKEYAPMKAMIDQRKAWTAKLPKDSSQLWPALAAMPRNEQMQLLAFVAAATVNVVVQKHDQRRGQVAHSHVLAAALNYDIRKDWKATAENFFNRVTKGTILASVAEARDEHTAELISAMKKAGMALEAARLVEGTGWIPAPMRPEVAESTDPDADDIDQLEELPAFLQGDTPEEATATA